MVSPWLRAVWLRPIRVLLICSGMVFAIMPGAGSQSLLLAADQHDSPQTDGLLQERLAAGEFGPALDAAGAIEDRTERTRQLHAISDAQRKHRDFRSAAETARRIPERVDRASARAAVSRDRSHSGGGNMADFTELIELIKSTVEPDSWDDVGGPGSTREYNTGVYVDPQGVMRQRTKADQTGTLEGLARRARLADLNEDLARPSPLRLVSLRRLEQQVSAQLAAGRPLPETLQRLAGLTRVEHVFVFPEENEIAIAGPAEGWRYDDAGRAVGRESARPVLNLDDFVVVFRAFAPGGDARFGCSINTRDANLKDVKEFVEASNRGGALRPGQLGKWLSELQKRLGMQDVVVHGIPADTRAAQVLVEADYKMKLIGIARYDGGPQIPSYFELLQKSKGTKGAPLEALRWWLTMKYDAVLHSPDKLAFQFEGSSVLVQSENQFVNAQGRHVPTGIAEPLNRQFAENFTRHYAELAKRDPVFGELQNLFDMALVAALCRQEGLLELAHWEPGAFAPQGDYQSLKFGPPKEVESVINHRVYGGKDIVVQVAGGVQADIAGVARDPALARDSESVAQRREGLRVPPGRWWWDADAR